MKIDKKENLNLINNIYIDNQRIKQILVYFISNSLKFTPIYGKIDVEIRIAS